MNSGGRIGDRFRSVMARARCLVAVSFRPGVGEAREGKTSASASLDGQFALKLAAARLCYASNPNFSHPKNTSQARLLLTSLAPTIEAHFNQA